MKKTGEVETWIDGFGLSQDVLSGRHPAGLVLMVRGVDLADLAVP
jgi:hypothetical protein